jgi:hypothetical protein
MNLRLFVLGFYSSLLLKLGFIFWSLHYMDVGRVSIVSEAHCASICRIELGRVGECLCTYGCLVQQTCWGVVGKGGAVTLWCCVN